MTQTAETGTTRVAGRELDAEIATRIMGYAWYAWTGAEGPQRFISRPQQMCGTLGSEYEIADMSLPLANRWDDILPAYSTDIAKAWLVVDAMKARAPMFSMAFVPAEHAFVFSGQLRVDGWFASFHRTDARLTATADTAPLAICLAALRALASSDSPESAETKDNTEARS